MKKQNYGYIGLVLALIGVSVYWVVKGNPLAPKAASSSSNSVNNSDTFIDPASLPMDQYLRRIDEQEARGWGLRKTVI